MAIYFQGSIVLFDQTKEGVKKASLLSLQVNQAHAKWVRDGRPPSMLGML